MPDLLSLSKGVPTASLLRIAPAATECFLLTVGDGRYEIFYDVHGTGDLMFIVPIDGDVFGLLDVGAVALLPKWSDDENAEKEPEMTEEIRDAAGVAYLLLPLIRGNVK